MDEDSWCAVVTVEYFGGQFQEVTPQGWGGGFGPWVEEVRCKTTDLIWELERQGCVLEMLPERGPMTWWPSGKREGVVRPTEVCRGLSSAAE